MSTIGIIGAGHIGSALAHLAVEHGHDVVIANSRGPDTLAGVVAELGPRARAGTVAEAARAGDLVIVAVPLRSVKEIDPALLAGKVVVDPTNYHPRRDGLVLALEGGTMTSSEYVQAHFRDARVVKALNHIPAPELRSDGLPPGSEHRRGAIVAGDDAEAKAIVAGFLDSIGFDPVDAGRLADTWRIQPGTPGHLIRQTAAELPAALAIASRRRHA